MAPKLQYPKYEVSTIKPLNEEAINDLRNGIVEGLIILPRDADYNPARMSWNQDTVGTPSVIVKVRSHHDITAALKCAKKHNIEVGVAGGKHSFYSSISDAMMIDLGLMTDVIVDPVNKTATAQGGAKLEHFDAACAPHGLATPCGTNPDTGVAGLTLGGGVGFLARRFGMTIDNLISAKIVLANGEVLELSSHTNEDLFWGIRGGGGNFGIVFEFVFQLHEIGSKGTVVSGSMIYLRPCIFRLFMEHPYTAMLKHRDYWSTMPREMGNVSVVVNRGPFISMYAYSGDLEEGHKIATETLPTLGKTFINCTNKEINYHRGTQRLALGPGEKEQATGFYFEKSILFDELTDEAMRIMWEASMAAVKGAFIFTALGGAIADVAPDATAFCHRNAKYWLIILGQWDGNAKDDTERQAVIAWVRETHQKLSPFSSGAYQALGEVDGAHTKTKEIDERIEAWRKVGDGIAVYGSNLPRLQELKRTYDPDNVFKFNRNVQPE